MKQRTTVGDFFSGFVDAAKGLGETIRTQFNIRMHFLISLIGIGLGFYYALNGIEWCMIILAIAIVWIAELFNTSIEYFSDFVSPEFNYLVGKVKDISAAAAFLAAITSLAIGLIIFIPKIFPN